MAVDYYVTEITFHRFYYTPDVLVFSRFGFLTVAHRESLRGKPFLLQPPFQDDNKEKAGENPEAVYDQATAARKDPLIAGSPF